MIMALSTPAGGSDAEAKDGRRRPAALRPADLLLISLGLALLAAFSQLALLALWKFRSGYTIRLGLDAIWMTPLAVTAVYAIPALLLVALSRLWPWFGSLPVVVGTFALLATIDIGLMERRLALWALWLLALGIGVQAGRLAEGRRAPFLRAMRWVVFGLVLVTVLGAVAVNVAVAARERRTLAGLPPARAGAPNILLLILDTVRAQDLSLYGYVHPTTPTLDSLARHAVVFDRAIAPATWTVPSHATMFTGQWPHALASWWGGSGQPGVPTIAEVLAEHGYRTGGFVANWYALGWESGFAQGFAHYDDFGRSIGQILRGSAMMRWLAGRRGLRRVIHAYDSLGRRDAPEISRSLARWLDRESDRPYFAFVNYLDAHSPYLPPPPFDRRFGIDVSKREPVVMEELHREEDLGPQVARVETASYDGSIAYLDGQLRLLFARLEARGMLANTVVVIASDHGEQIGEHGFWGHGHTLRTQTIHVPLMIMGPGTVEGLRVAAPATLRDIPETIADLAGLDRTPFPGASLSRYWRAGGAGAAEGDTILSEESQRRSLHVGRYHFFQDADSGSHLYDYATDPLEEHDLVESAVADTLLPAFEAILDALSAEPLPNALPAADAGTVRRRRDTPCGPADSSRASSTTAKARGRPVEPRCPSTAGIGRQ